MKKEKLNIIYEDKYIIVVNKKSGLLTISTLKEKENTLYREVSDYLQKQNKNNKVFIVHRLDQDTSGLIIFAKSIKVKRLLQDNWSNVKRGYIGIVWGKLKKDKDTIKLYLNETNTHLVYKANKGKLAITEYESIISNNKYTLVKINILTGRKHQIRVSFKEIGNPLVGDKKYSNIKDNNKLCLHAMYLKFIHPITNKNIILYSKYPEYFNKFIKYDKDILF